MHVVIGLLAITWVCPLSIGQQEKEEQAVSTGIYEALSRSTLYAPGPFDFNEIINKAISNFRELILSGDLFRFFLVDPLKVPDITYADQFAGIPYVVHIKNTTVTGLSGFKCDHFNADPNQRRVEYGCMVPNLTAFYIYDFLTVIYGFPFIGGGNVRTEAKDVKWRSGATLLPGQLGQSTRLMDMPGNLSFGDLRIFTMNTFGGNMQNNPSNSVLLWQMVQIQNAATQEEKDTGMGLLKVLAKDL